MYRRLRSTIYTSTWPLPSWLADLNITTKHRATLQQYPQWSQTLYENAIYLLGWIHEKTFFFPSSLQRPRNYPKRTWLDWTRNLQAPQTRLKSIKGCFIYILDSSNSSSFTFWSSQFTSSSRSNWTGNPTVNSNGSWNDKHSCHFSTAKEISAKAAFFFM